MKDIISLKEYLNKNNRGENINEGILSSLSNLFTANYEIKNPILKELLREVDCPISWKETKLKNSILKLVDEFVATQAKTYAEELISARDKDAKEDAGDIVFDSETRFGSLKNKRLVEKASATLSAMKNLVSSSKTAKDAGATWVQIVYDEAVIATIQTALKNSEISDEIKAIEMNSLEKAQEQLNKEKKDIHEKNTKDFLKVYSKCHPTTMNNYKVAYENGTEAFNDLKKLIENKGIGVFDDNKSLDAFGINKGKNINNAVAAVTVLGLTGAYNEETTKDLIEKIKKSEGGEKNLAAAYTTADYIIGQLASDKYDAAMLKSLKQFMSTKSFGDVSSLIDRLVAYTASIAKSLSNSKYDDIAEVASRIYLNNDNVWNK